MDRILLFRSLLALAPAFDRFLGSALGVAESDSHRHRTAFDFDSRFTALFKTGVDVDRIASYAASGWRPKEIDLLENTGGKIFGIWLRCIRLFVNERAPSDAGVIEF